VKALAPALRCGHGHALAVFGFLKGIAASRPGLLWVELEQPDSDEEEKEAHELTKDGGENARTCPKPEVWLLAKVELALVCEVGGGELPRVCTAVG